MPASPFNPTAMPLAKTDLPLRCIPAAVLLLLAGCANLQAPPAAAPTPPAAASSVTGQPAGAPVTAQSAAAAASGAAAPAARPDPAALKAFAEIIKDAKRDDGYLAVWRKDEKVWLEIPADRLGQPFLLTANVSNSVGERGLYAGQMARDAVGEFRRIGNTMQLLARNMTYRSSGDAAMQRAVRQSFSDSLVGSTPVLSQPHPERKSVLVDASFLLSDLLSYSTALEQAYRLPFALDRANSFFEASTANARLTSLSTQMHFSTARIPAPPLTPPPPGSPQPPSPPTTVPDPRSFFVGVVYNFAALPDKPMAPRLADPRVGHFTDAFLELGSDVKPNPRVHYINRWRLEKKDPAAALSEPVKPITFWLDRNIPLRYRASVEAGIVEWNKAFERIGFKNAVVARQQPDDATFDTMDAEHASIRWFTGADVGFARGPSHSDPRSGEILDADISMSDVFARGSRRFITEDVGFSSSTQALATSLWSKAGDAYCNYAAEASTEMGFALDLLEARGDIEPDSPEAEAFVQDVIKDTITHEVGHTLGLKHNFRASTTITRTQLQDKDFTASNGISGSVMDYNGYNISLEGERRGSANQTTLGAYDYWAIEYAYRPLDPASEATELARIAARSTEPALAFADDADAGGFGGVEGLDPRVNRFDLGDDPLAWARKRLALSKELWARVQQRGAKVGDDPQRLRRSVRAGFVQAARLPEMVAKYVGGMYTERDLPGSSGRPSFRPVEPDKQREALRFLSEGLFSADSFRFKPEFLAVMPPDFVEWERGGPVSVPTSVLALQTQALDRLLSAGTARRMIELPYYLSESERRGAITLNEVYSTVRSAIWKELDGGAEIDPMRRNLQREHLRRLTALLTRGGPGLPADALSLVRWHAAELQTALRTASARRNLSVESRAHVQDSLGALTEALRATMQRS